MCNSGWGKEAAVLQLFGRQAANLCTGPWTESYDRCTVKDAVKALEKNDYRFSSLVDSHCYQRSVYDAGGKSENNEYSNESTDTAHRSPRTGRFARTAMAGIDWHRAAVASADFRGVSDAASEWRSSSCPTASIFPIGHPSWKATAMTCRTSCSPLAPVQDDVMVISGLTHDKGRANGDGAGDHARSASVFLTGAQPRKTDGESSAREFRWIKSPPSGRPRDAICFVGTGMRTRPECR